VAAVAYEKTTKRFGDVVALSSLDLEIAQGEFMVLLGPSGSGKTTALRIAAGFEALSDGAIRIGERDVSRVPPAQRDVAMVFQDYALYPQMTVEKNMGFGLRMRKVKRDEIKTRVAHAAETLGLAELLERRPAQLSGGQRQRVALGRAIVREPRVFLMDEPLSNLDAALRMEMRAEIIKLQERLAVTTFYVTHDQVEALSMGDRIVVMRNGRIQQVGSPTELYEQPQNAYVASFIGSPPMNFLHGRVTGDDIVLADERTTLTVDGGARAALSRASDREITIGVRPEHIVFSDRPATGSILSIAGAVDTVEPLGHTTLVRAKLASGKRLSVLVADKVRLQEGEAVFATFTPDRLYLFDTKSEQALLGISE